MPVRSDDVVRSRHGLGYKIGAITVVFLRVDVHIASARAHCENIFHMPGRIIDEIKLPMLWPVAFWEKLNLGTHRFTRPDEPGIGGYLDGRDTTGEQSRRGACSYEVGPTFQRFQCVAP